MESKICEFCGERVTGEGDKHAIYQCDVRKMILGTNLLEKDKSKHVVKCYRCKELCTFE